MRSTRRSSNPRHRADWSLTRALPRSEILVVGAITTLAFVGVAIDQSTQVSTATAAPAAIEQPQQGTVDVTGMRSGSVGAAGTLQNPVPAALTEPVEGVTPSRLSIPAIGVDVPLGELGRDEAGVLVPPTRLMEAGWYHESVVPGAVGPSVIAGHVDDTEMAGVFARLHELSPGDEIVVVLSDGSESRFTVDRSIDTAKAAFPTEVVYGPTRDAQLRLITCNGPYDFGVMHYSNNLIVMASGVG